MSDTTWHKCPNLQECTEGNRFGKGCVADPVQSAMGGKPWHECHCGVDSDGNPPNLLQADEITRLRAEVEKLKAALRQIAGIDTWDDNEQGYVDKARAALGDTP